MAHRTRLSRTTWLNLTYIGGYESQALISAVRDYNDYWWAATLSGGSLHQSVTNQAIIDAALSQTPAAEFAPADNQ